MPPKEDKAMHEFLSRRRAQIDAIFRIVLGVVLSGTITLQVFMLKELRGLSEWRAKQDEWRGKWTNYPNDAKDLQLRIQQDIAVERGVAFDRLYNKLDALSVGLSAMTLEFREFKAREEAGDK